MSQKLNINHELYEAASRGNTEKLTELLSQNQDMDFKYKHPQTELTALTISVREGYCHIVSLLLKHGANPNRSIIYEGRVRVSLLHLAAVAGHPALVKLLLRAGANPTAEFNNWGGFDKTVVMEESVVYVLCETNSTADEILLQFQRQHSLTPSYGMKRNIKLMKRAMATREAVCKKHNNIIARVQSLLRESEEVNPFLEWLYRRIKAEKALKNVLQNPSEDQDVVLLTTVQLQFQEKLLSKFGILEEDCMNLSVRREILIAEVSALSDHLHDKKETAFLQDLVALRTALEKMNLTALASAVKAGLMRTSNVESTSLMSNPLPATIPLHPSPSTNNPLPSTFRLPPPTTNPFPATLYSAPANNPLPPTFRPPPPTTNPLPGTFRPPPPTTNPLPGTFRPPPPPSTTIPHPATFDHSPFPSITNSLPATFRPPPPPPPPTIPLFGTPPLLLEEVCLQKQLRAQYLERLRLQLQALMLRTQREHQQAGEVEEEEQGDVCVDDCEPQLLVQRHPHQQEEEEECMGSQCESENSSEEECTYKSESSSEEEYTYKSESGSEEENTDWSEGEEEAEAFLVV